MDHLDRDVSLLSVESTSPWREAFFMTLETISDKEMKSSTPGRERHQQFDRSRRRLADWRPWTYVNLKVGAVGDVDKIVGP